MLFAAGLLSKKFWRGFSCFLIISLWFPELPGDEEQHLCMYSGGGPLRFDCGSDPDLADSNCLLVDILAGICWQKKNPSKLETNHVRLMSGGLSMSRSQDILGSHLPLPAFGVRSSQLPWPATGKLPCHVPR